MRVRLSLPVALAAFALVFAFCACSARSRGPNLVELGELRPRHVEPGDRLHLDGSGFPEGRPAQIQLRGDLHRAGVAPVRDVSVTADAELVSPHALEVTVTRALATKLCGHEDPRRTTFRGDVEVAFSPRSSAGSAVTGRLDGVVLDVTPETSAETALAALQAQGERFARFVGASLRPAEEGLLVGAIKPRGRAARAGLESGDTLLELEGMIVRGLSDLVPPPNAKSSRLVVRRGAERLTLRLDSSGFRYSPPEALASAIVLIGIALFGFVLLCSPIGRVLGFVERRAVDRLRDAALPLSSGPLSVALLPRAVRGLAQRLPSSFFPYFGLVAASALFTLLALGKSVVASELDLLVVPAASGVALFFVAAISGHDPQGTRWSLGDGVRRSLALAPLLVPLAAVLVGAALETGSLRADEIVAAQGAFPWQWTGFRSPALFAAGALAVAALVPRVRREPSLGPAPKRRAREHALDAAQAVHELVSVGVLAIVLFGGWQITSARVGASAVANASLALSIAGALLLLAKSWGLLLAVAALRWALGGVDVRAIARAGWAWLALPSALSAASALLLRSAESHPILATLRAGFGPALVASSVIGLGWLWVRVREGVRTPTTELRIQPWL